MLNFPYFSVTYELRKDENIRFAEKFGIPFVVSGKTPITLRTVRGMPQIAMAQGLCTPHSSVPDSIPGKHENT